MMTRDQLRQHALGTLRKLESDTLLMGSVPSIKHDEVELLLLALIDKLTLGEVSREVRTRATTVRRLGGMVPVL